MSQSGREHSGFTPPATSKPRPADGNETVASTTLKCSVHSHPPVLEPSLSKRQKPNEPVEQQDDAPVSVFPRVQSTPAPIFGTKTSVGSRKSLAPLAERMRPASVDLVVGQDHLLRPGCILRSLIDNNTLSSIIFWGPPGTGKTSLVRAIARAVSYRFIALSAVSCGLKEVREILEEAKRVRKFGERTLLFLDEIHRLVQIFCAFIFCSPSPPSDLHLLLISFNYDGMFYQVVLILLSVICTQVQQISAGCISSLRGGWSYSVYRSNHRKPFLRDQCCAVVSMPSTNSQ